MLAKASFFILLCVTLGCQSFRNPTRFWNSSKSAPPSPESPASETTTPATTATTTSPENTSQEPQATSPATTPVDVKTAADHLNGKLDEKAESSFRIGDVETILAQPGGWIGTPKNLRDTQKQHNPQEQHHEVSWNWYHPGIEEILAWPEENDPILRETLQKKEPVSATNAAICLARVGDSSGVPVLLGAIRSPRLEMPIRAAAAEALASLDTSTQTIQKLIDEYSDEGKTPNPDLYRELITGLARHIDPAGNQRFLAALKSRDVGVRLAAIEAWSKSQSKVLPDELVYLVADQNDKNRSAVMHALGTHDHPQRMHYINSGLHDANYLVRVAAVEALGQIRSKEAIDWLEEATTSSSPIVRAAAVRSLATAGQNEMALKLAKDQAWQVRLAVAEVLAEDKTPNANTLDVARTLLHDRSPQVQSQTLSSIDTWPLANSGPLLLDAIEKLGFQARQEATTQLAKHWEPAKRFPRHAPEEVRQRTITQLRDEFQQEFGRFDAGAVDLAQIGTEATSARIDPTLVTRAKRLIAKHEDPRCASADRYQIRQTLRGLSPNPMAVLEYLVFEENQELPEAFYTTLLPELDPTFDILYRMQEETTTSTKIPTREQKEKAMARRRAASDLIRLTAEHKPSRLALDRLAEQMLQESDALVWRSVLIAFADNGSESMLQMIRVAIGHESAEVRRRACEWLAAHPDPGNFKLLKPALDDTNQNVKIAAVRAIVAGGNLDDTEPLENILDDNQTATKKDRLAAQVTMHNQSRAERKNIEPPTINLQEIEPLTKLLGDSNEELRIEVAYALAAFGDEKGPQALKQLARSRDANVRQKAAEAMGRLEDPRYASFLISLLDDQLNVRHAALDALPKAVGHEVPAAGDRRPTTPTESITRWKEWHAHRTGSSFR